MTPKQRFESALKFQQPDDYIPFMEIEFHIFEDFIGKEPILGYKFAKLSQKEKEKAYYYNAEVIIETAQRAGHDAIKDFPGIWEVSPGVPAYLWLADDESRLKQFEVLKKMAGDQYFVMGQVGATMSIPDGNQIYGFVCDLYENKEVLKDRFERQLNKSIEFQNKVVDLGADGIINASDVAFNNGPFISPELMDEFFFPYFIRWVDSLKQSKVYSIWHTDGNIYPIMDRVYKTGVDAVQGIDPIAGMDIVSLSKEARGKTTLIGNIDCSMLQTGTPEEIELSVKNVVENCKYGGGVVLCGCNAIFKGITARNYMAMVEARYKYGKCDNGEVSPDCK